MSFSAPQNGHALHSLAREPSQLGGLLLPSSSRLPWHLLWPPPPHLGVIAGLLNSPYYQEAEQDCGGRAGTDSLGFK